MIDGPIEVLVPELYRDQHVVVRSGYVREPRARVMGAGRELFGLRKDGSEFPVEISLSPIESEGRTLVTSAIRDVSDRKRLEDQLQSKNDALEEQNERVVAANRLKSEFLANMSHELRTPLNAIIGFSELMHDGKVGPVGAEHKEYLGDILASSRHLLQLINDILDLAKVESGKMEFHPEPIEIDRLVSELRDVLRALLVQKRMRLTVDIAPTLGEIVGDPAKLKQVLYNYLSNAIKFTPDEGEVTIAVRPEDTEHFRIEVRDTGAGIKADDLGKLFLEFQQLDATASKRHAGTGLGLALTKRIVEAQGGEVGVCSTPGQGSVFFAILPLVGVPSIEAEREPPETPRGQPGAGSPAVLIVEDDPKDRQWLRKTVTEAGYGATTATTGAEAIARCRERAFAAITLDLLLPDMSGWDVLRAIRADALNCEAPVIVIGVVAETAAPVVYPIQDILNKPIDSEELLLALQRAKPSSAGSQKIMIVDDNASDRKLAETILTSAGYDVIGVPDGESALREFADRQPDLIVLDLLMPNMSGFEFLERLREGQEGIGVPVVIWTNKDVSGEERAALRPATAGLVLKGDDVASMLLRELEAHLPIPRGVVRLGCN